MHAAEPAAPAAPRRWWCGPGRAPLARGDRPRCPSASGGSADNELILRDSRASRTHARIVLEERRYVVEDAGSRHGVWVNGKRVTRHALAIRRPHRIRMSRIPTRWSSRRMAPNCEEAIEQAALVGAPGGPGGNLAKLRAILEVARTLQTGFSDRGRAERSVVDAALAITGAERGFLLLAPRRGAGNARGARPRRHAARCRPT